MIKKIITIIMILLLGAGCVTAGLFILKDKKSDPIETQDIATQPQPGVTQTEGLVRPGTGPVKTLEAKIIKLTDDKMYVIIQGVEWELILPEKVHNDITRMNELGIEIKVGTFVSVQYTLEDEGRVVKSVARLDLN